MLPDPADLYRFAGELTAVGRELADARVGVLATTAVPGWSGIARDRFHTEAAAIAGQLQLLSERAGEGASAAGRLAAELAELHLVEGRVMAALHRAAGWIAGTAAADVRFVYQHTLATLPPRGSPEWRDVARRLTAVGLL